MRVVALLLILAILSPGCTRERANPYEPAVADNYGVVRVIVQDNHDARVFNATILITPGGAFGYTDEQGIFMAEDIPPGNQTITVNAEGYSDSHRTVKIKAGEINEVVLFVDRIR